MLKQCKRHILNSCSHSIHSVHRTDDYRISESSGSVLYAYGLKIRHSGEILPHLALKTVLCEFLTKNRIGLTNCFQSVASDCTQTANSKSGTRERLTIYHAVRKTESLSDHTNLILKEQLNRLNQLKLQILRKTAYIVMSLYAVAFQNVRINSTLCQELDA